MMQQTLPFVDEVEATFSNRALKDVTFLGKAELPIHRWFRLTASFSPFLVRDILRHFNLPAGRTILDPFCGVGTVPLMAQEMGLRSIGVEINPFLQFVAKVKTTHYTDAKALRQHTLALLREMRSRVEQARATDIDAFFADHEPWTPKIHNVFRWWSPRVLKELVAIKRLLAESGNPSDQPIALLRLAVLSILIEVSNARYNHVSVTFSKQPIEYTDVLLKLEATVRQMLADVEAVSYEERPEVLIIPGDSRQLKNLLPDNSQISAVITSPPYPNRFSYVRETRPHLFFFDFITDSDSAGELDLQTIGGTWGRATSVLSQDVEPKNRFLRELLSPIVHRVRQRGRLMANYIVRYFDAMYDHIAQIAELVPRGAPLAYVIGNSKFYGVELESDLMLSKIFEHFGIATEAIHKMRKRNSKSGLYEAVILMKKA